MRNLKRVLSLLVALAMCMSIMSVGVFAEYEDDAEEDAAPVEATVETEETSEDSEDAAPVEATSDEDEEQAAAEEQTAESEEESEEAAAPDAEEDAASDEDDPAPVEEQAAETEEVSEEEAAPDAEAEDGADAEGEEIGLPGATIVPAPAIALPALFPAEGFTDSRTVAGYTVTVAVEPESFAEAVSLRVMALGWNTIDDATRELLLASGLTEDDALLDIGFINADAEEIEPLKPVAVSIEAAGAEIAEVYHVEDAETVTQVAEDVETVAEFEVEGFSLFAIKAKGAATFTAINETTLVAAITEAGDGGTVQLLENVALSSALVIDDGKEITIDLNGHTLSGGYIDLYSGFLTVTDSGATKGSFNNLVYANVGSDDTKAAGAYNSFTLTAGTTMNNDVYVYQNDTVKGYGTKVTISGTMNGLIFVLGNIHEGNTVVDVYGTINSPDDVGIALNGYATVNVYEGAVISSKDSSNKGTAIEVRAGTLNVYGGTMTGHGVSTTVTPNGSGTTSTGAGIAVSQHTTKLAIDVKISGGTINGYSAFYESNPQNNSADDLAKITLSITGGTFNTTEGGTAAIYSQDKTAFLTGGTYSSDPSAFVDLTEYDVINNDDGTYTVRENQVAQIGSKTYPTLAKAIAAVPTGTKTTITMIANIDDVITKDVGSTGAYWKIANGQNIVLDLNGHTIKLTESVCQPDPETAKSYAMFENSGTFTVDDTSAAGTGTILFNHPYYKMYTVGYTAYKYNIYRNDVANKGTFILNNGLIKQEAFEVDGYTDGAGTAMYTVDNYVGSSFTMNGGHLYNYFSNAVRVFDNGPAASSITFNDGLIEGYYSVWLQYTNNTTLTINGGTFKTTAKKYPESNTQLYNTSSSTTSLDVVITGGTFYENVTLYGENVDLEVTGGTFEGYVYTCGTTNISDGIFNGYVYVNAAGKQSTISGGTFNGSYVYSSSSDVTDLSITGGEFIEGGGYFRSYIATGYHAHDNGNGTYTVHKCNLNVSWEWVENNASATATFTCKLSGAANRTWTMTDSAPVVSDGTYTATVTGPDGKTYTATNTGATTETATAKTSTIESTTTTTAVTGTTDTTSGTAATTYKVATTTTTGVETNETNSVTVDVTTAAVAAVSDVVEVTGTASDTAKTTAATSVANATANAAESTVKATQVNLVSTLAEATAETETVDATQLSGVDVAIKVKATLETYEVKEEEEAVVVSELTFEVSPYAEVTFTDTDSKIETITKDIDNADLTATAADPIIVRLTLPSTFNAAYARVVHDGEDLGLLPVKTENGVKFVEVPVTHFSPFTVTASYTVTYQGAGLTTQTSTGIAYGATTPTFGGSTTRGNYRFDGWSPAVASTVTADATYTAQWTAIPVVSYDDGDSYTAPAPQQTTTITDEETPLSEFPIFYVDVADDSWYHDAIAYVTALGVMNGVSDDKFSPNASTTRGMVATVLMRLANGESVSLDSFSDVADSAYYAESAAWAVENGVFVGFEDGTFRGETVITREQFAAALYRYAVAMGYNVSGKAALDAYDDGTLVSGYASEAMAWAVESGIIQGIGNNKLDPTGSATRAQLATMLMRFHALYTAEM